MIGSVLHLGVTPENFDLVRTATIISSTGMNAPLGGRVKVTHYDETVIGI